MSLTKQNRKMFIESAVQFIERYHLEGLDIDWEYPGLIGYNNRFRPEDKRNYTALLKELRKRFDRRGKEAGVRTAWVRAYCYSLRFWISDVKKRTVVLTKWKL